MQFLSVRGHDAEAGDERLVGGFIHGRLVMRIPWFVHLLELDLTVGLRKHRVPVLDISIPRPGVPDSLSHYPTISLSYYLTTALRLLRSRSRLLSEIEAAGPPRSTLITSAMIQTAISAGVWAPMAMPMGA